MQQLRRLTLEELEAQIAIYAAEDRPLFLLACRLRIAARSPGVGDADGR